MMPNSAKRDLREIFTRRTVLLGGAGLAAFGAIGARLVFLQTLDPTDYTAQADENRFDTRVVAPPRGVIYDRFGERLAITSRDYRVHIIPEQAGKREEVAETVRKVCALLGLSPEVTERRVREVLTHRRFDPVLIRQGLTWDEFAAVNVRLPELPGVTAEAGEQRFYPYMSAFAHPVGYVQKPNEREVAKAEEADPLRAMYLRNPNVRVGKTGLEARLERTLHGEAGWKKVEVDARGRTVSEFGHESKPPKEGAGVVLTLDAELQRIAMERMGGEAASCVVMDIWTGDLIVLASAPGFDPNAFVNGIPSPAFRALNEDPYKPLYHKSVKGAYKPGSTFKIVTALAAAEAGVGPDFRVSCPGHFTFGGRRFHCWRRGGHGSVDGRRAMKESCNVYFYNAALRAGPERIADVARRLGCGTAFDIGLPMGEMEDGIVPEPAWYQSVRNAPWPPGNTLNTGIGQGDLLLTPLQLAVVTARVANGGKAVMPRLVREAPGAQPDVPAPADLRFPQEGLQATLDGLVAVCNEPGGTAFGTNGNLGLVRHPETGRIVEAAAAPANAVKVQVAGKTGTAQVRIITSAERVTGVKRNEDLPWHMRDHALFVFYGPVDAPRYAGVVVVEHGGGGGRAAAPIGADVMRATLLRDPSARKPMTLAGLEDGRAPA